MMTWRELFRRLWRVLRARFRREIPEYEPGDRVWLVRYLEPRPGIVVDRVDRKRYIVVRPKLNYDHTHFDHVTFKHIRSRTIAVVNECEMLAAIHDMRALETAP